MRISIYVLLFIFLGAFLSIYVTGVIKYIIMRDNIDNINSNIMHNYTSVKCTIEYGFDDGKMKIDGKDYKIPISKKYTFYIGDITKTYTEKLINCPLFGENTYYDMYKKCKKEVIVANNDTDKKYGTNLYYYKIYKDGDRLFDEHEILPFNEINLGNIKIYNIIMYILCALMLLAGLVLIYRIEYKKKNA